MHVSNSLLNIGAIQQIEITLGIAHNNTMLKRILRVAPTWPSE